MWIIDLVATGRKIKKLRPEAGLFVRDLQERLGFSSPQAIYKWQSGLTTPKVDNLVILADVFGVGNTKLYLIKINSHVHIFGIDF